MFSEDFNSGLGSWSTTNTSTGGTPAAAAWTSRPDSYFYNGYGSPDPTFSSNDASPFVLSNSDAQGSGTTATTLVSPGFSTVGYSSLSLSYYHYYRYNASESANVDISTDGTNWTTEQTYTSTQGADDGFVQSTVDLSAYAGQPQLFIRFRYDATWDWWWAIDNVSVTGTPAPTSFSWTSTPAGFTSTDQNPMNVTVNANTTFHFTPRVRHAEPRRAHCIGDRRSSARTRHQWYARRLQQRCSNKPSCRFGWRNTEWRWFLDRSEPGQRWHVRTCDHGSGGVHLYRFCRTLRERQLPR
ncbi:MAG: choice-of-anchor J domain-containing protein [Flavobacteriales bacterium]|nr:choice-of-anchor J domain-containing protein [Flavobacteriales bacterium]